ncbi:MAG: hypothetical protein V1752_08985 [Candidatus Firestonebacteria bacterium]
MKRLGLVLVVFAVVLGVSSAANAEDVGLKGKLGIGYTNSGTPLGAKMWLSDGFGVDASVGVNTANAQVFGIQLGVDMVMANKYPVILEFRPAVGLDFGAVVNFSIPLMLNIEYFVTKNLSLSAGTGVLLTVTPAFVFSHCVVATNNLGVIYYF